MLAHAHTHACTRSRTHTGYVFFSWPYSVFPRGSRVLLFCLSVTMFLMRSPASPSPHLCLSPPRDQTLHLENPTVSGKVYTESLLGNINLLWGFSTIQSPRTPSCRKSSWLDDYPSQPFSHQQSCGNLGTLVDDNSALACHVHSLSLFLSLLLPLHCSMLLLIYVMWTFWFILPLLFAF